MTRPLLIDLFCGAGGCAMGYYRAGFDVLGVDHEPQPRYPFEFIQGDVFEVWDDLPEATAYHASPPCQRYSKITPEEYRQGHPDLIGETQRLLRAAGKPYVIENVPGAPLLSPIRLCGSSFGLRVRRHRLFESSFFLLAPPCQHFWQDQDKVFSIYRHGEWVESGVAWVYGSGGGKANAHWPEAMGIDWMTHDELAQAIPPAYTEYIGGRLMEHIQVTTMSTTPSRYARVVGSFASLQTGMANTSSSHLNWYTRTTLKRPGGISNTLRPKRQRRHHDFHLP